MPKLSAYFTFRRIRYYNFHHNNMELEGITREELQEAAAELQHLQTLALQGADFAAAPTQRHHAPQPMNAARPPILEVPLTPSAASTMATPTRSGDDTVSHPNKYTRHGGKGPDGRKGQADRPGTAETISAASQGTTAGAPKGLRQSTLEQAGFGSSGCATKTSSRGSPNPPPGFSSRDRTPSVCGSSPSALGTGMASHETRLARVHSSTVEDYIVSNVGCRSERSSGSNHARSGQQAAGAGSPGDGGAGSVPVQKVECYPPCSREHSRSDASDAQRGSHSPQRGDHLGDPGGSAGELSCEPTPSGRNVGTHGNVLPCAGTSRAEIVQNVEYPGDPAKQCIPHVSRDDTAKGEASQVSAGAVVSTGDSSAVASLNLIRVKLMNQGNECYANSVLLAILWTSALHSPSEASMRQSLHDDLQALLRSSAPQHIWSRPLIQRCLRRWPHNGRQQDAADFLQHFAQAAQLTHFQGNWSIMSEGSLKDCGGVSPLVLQCNLQDLPLHRGICPLQSVVQQWQSTASQPALHAGTACVAIQLDRFTVVDRAVHKLSTPVSLPRTIRLPSWVEGSLRQSEYRICAALVNLGSTPHSGHYRALLIENSGKMWWTDDNVSARPPRKDEASVLLRNVYIIFLRPSPTASFGA